MTESSTSPNAKDEAKGFFQKYRVWFLMIFLLAVSNTGIYFYQKVQMKKQEEKFGKELVRKAELAEQYAVDRNEEYSETAAKALAWGFRAELLRGNIELCNQFMIDMVQNTGLDLLIIADSLGNVRLSTDKKYEGKQVRDVFPVIPISLDRQKILRSGLEEVVVAAPINDFDHAIGSFLMVYKPKEETMQLIRAMGENPFAKEEKE